MQFDPTQSAFSPRSLPNPHKRPLTHQASASAQQQPQPSSSKVPRVDSAQASSSFSFSRQTTNVDNGPNIIPPPTARMPQSSQSQPSRPNRAFGQRPSHSAGPSRLSGRGRGGKGASRKVLEGPLHDEAFIIREYKKSPLPLKPIHESTPKSSLGNFAMLAIGKPLTYKFSDGFIAQEPRGISTPIWR